MEINKDNELSTKIGFKAFFKETYPSLCLFATHYLHDKQVSSDIAQEAFIYLWGKVDHISSTASAKSYLYKYVKNRCLNYLRDTERRKEILKEQLYTERYYYDNVIEQETYELVYKAIKNLSPQGQQVIELSLDGLSNKEIAEKLNVSVNTIKTVKQRAFNSLRKKLDPGMFNFFLAFLDN